MQIVVVPDSYKGKVAMQCNIPVFCLTGGLDDQAEDAPSQSIDGVMSISLTHAACISPSSALVESASPRFCRIIKAARP